MTYSTVTGYPFDMNDDETEDEYADRMITLSDTGWNRDVRHHLRERDYGWHGSQIRVQRDSDGQLVAWSNLGRQQWRDNGGGPGEGHSESGFAANH
jgi:hypothetical protein